MEKYENNPSSKFLGEEKILRENDSLEIYSESNTDSYIRFNPNALDLAIKLMEGNSKSQSIFIVAKLLTLEGTLDLVAIRFNEINKLLEDIGVKRWNRSQLSKVISFLVKSRILFRSTIRNKYWVNCEYMYNCINKLYKKD